MGNSLTSRQIPSERGSVQGLLSRAARLFPDRIATVGEDGQERTYKEVKERVARWANGFLRAGLKPGDRVAALMLNGSPYFELYFATAWAGLLMVPLNHRLADEELRLRLNNCGASALVVDEEFCDRGPLLAEKLDKTDCLVVFVGNCTSSRDVTLVRRSSSSHELWSEEMIFQCPSIPESGIGGDNPYGIFYTGGTTSGIGKGVMLSHRNILLNALWSCGHVPITGESRFLHVAPAFHLADAQFNFAVTMAAGTHVFVRKFYPDHTFKTVQDRKVSIVCLVPVMINMCLNAPGQEAYDLTSLCTLTYGGSPISEALLERVLKRFPNAKLHQGYGMTEWAPALTNLFHDDHAGQRLKSAGKPVYFNELMIADENGQEVERGVVGEIVARGPGLMIGYWGWTAQQHEELFWKDGGWFRTGDGGYMDQDGFVYVVDRLKDMIVSGGENVYSIEVERQVAKFPGVAMCAVIGTPDKKYGELVTAIITLKPGVKEFTLEELRATLKESIAGYKCPRKLVIRDKLPLTGANKIIKSALRKEFWQGEACQVYSANPKATTGYK